jgi:polysaccharide biosynthesis transport protein
MGRSEADSNDGVRANMSKQTLKVSDTAARGATRLSVGAEEFDLRRLITIVRRRALWILGAVVLFVGGLLAKSATETPLYTSTAELLLQRAEGEDQPGGASTNPVYLPARTVATEVRVLESRAVATLANKKLGFKAKIGAVGIPDADIVRVTAVDASQARAARIANTFADQYIVFRKSGSVEDRLVAAKQLDDRVAQQEQELESLEGKITRLSPSEASTLQTLELTRTNLVNQISSWRNKAEALRLEATLKTGGARVINRAEIPTSPTSPKPIRNLVLGILLGLLIGTGLAFAIDLLDDRVRTKDDLDAMNLGIPVLGLIPKSNSYKRSEVPELESFNSSSSPVAEAYRTLRSAVQFAGIERDLKVLLVTSTDAAESKSTTSANLAVTLARSGTTVCLIDADLRNARLHMFFGVRQKEGLTNVLLGTERPPDVIVSFAELEELGMMPAGPKAPNPAELLGSNRMGVLLNALKKRFDLVIIDSPPILPVVDSLELARQVDGVLITTLVGRTKRRGLGHAVELLSNVDAPLLGLVLTGVDKSGGYGYGYGYGYGETDDTNGAKPKRKKKNQASPVAQSGLTVRSGSDKTNEGFPTEEFPVVAPPASNGSNGSNGSNASNGSNGSGASFGSKPGALVRSLSDLKSPDPKNPINAVRTRASVNAMLAANKAAENANAASIASIASGDTLDATATAGIKATDSGPLDADGDPVVPKST